VGEKLRFGVIGKDRSVARLRKILAQADEFGSLRFELVPGVLKL